MSISENINKIKINIIRASENSGRNPLDVEIVCVTKTIDVDRIKEALSAGINIIGENRIQEAIQKIPSIGNLGVKFHLIGHLQSNKVKKAVELFDLIHSVDSFKLAEEIGRKAMAKGKTMPILLQLNISLEDSKSGFEVDELQRILPKITQIEGIKIQGLMTMAPLCADPRETRPMFKKAKDIFDMLKCKDLPNFEMKYLSMGMSQDFIIAVEEGANLVRIGTSIFNAP